MSRNEFARRFEVFQDEFVNLSLPCEYHLTEMHLSRPETFLTGNGINFFWKRTLLFQEPYQIVKRENCDIF